MYKKHCQRFNTGVFYTPAKIPSLKKSILKTDRIFVREKHISILLHFITILKKFKRYNFLLKYESETHEF